MTRIVAAALGLTILVGCGGNAGPSYDQALQTYQTERAELDRLLSEKTRWEHAAADYIRESGEKLSQLEKTLWDSTTKSGLSAADMKQRFAENQRKTDSLKAEIDKHTSEISANAKKVLAALAPEIQRQEEKVAKAKAIMDEAEKRR